MAECVVVSDVESGQLPRHGMGDSRMVDLIELILKDRPRLHELIRDERRQGELIPRLLAVSCLSFVFFGVAMTIMLASAGVWPQLTAIAAWLDNPHQPVLSLAALESSTPFLASWMDGAALKLIAAYTFGQIAATGICLPSLYFYSLLSGVRMSMLDCTVHALKAKATAAVALIGILPIYVALCMAVVIFPLAPELRQAVLYLGLLLPFIAGLWGTRSLYVGFLGLCDTLPAQRQERRTCFLRRLVLSWSAVYTAVMPLMIFTLWQWLES